MDKTLCWKGVGRVGEGIEVTAVLVEVHILSRQSLTRKERLEGKSGLLGMINMIWGIQVVSLGTFVDILPVQ